MVTEWNHSTLIQMAIHADKQGREPLQGASYYAQPASEENEVRRTKAIKNKLNPNNPYYELVSFLGDKTDL